MGGKENGNDQRLPQMTNPPDLVYTSSSISETSTSRFMIQQPSMRLPSASTLLVIQFPLPRTPPANCFLLSHQPISWLPFTLQSTA